MARILVVGCGAVGRQVVERLLAQGHAVTGVVKRSAAAVHAAGAEPVALDLDREPPSASPIASGYEVVLWLAPPPREGELDSRLRRHLPRLATDARRLVYLSTSGVYGDCEGRWIDETEPVKPATPRAIRRLDAEC